VEDHREAVRDGVTMAEATRIIDSHAHIGDIFHERRNVTFMTNVPLSGEEDPFLACERAGYAWPSGGGGGMDELIHAGQRRCWEWTLENFGRALEPHPEVAGVVMLPIWPNQTFEEMLAASSLDPRVIPFTTCVLDMDAGGMCEKLRRDIARGAKGLKLHPTLQNAPLTDPKVEAAVQVFADAGLPVLTHCGANPYYVEASPWAARTNPAYSAFGEVMAFCRRWTGAHVIVAHNAAGCEGLAAQAGGLGNVWTDTSMCPAALMRRAVELLGEDRVLFGTDAPFGTFQYSLAELYKAFGGEPRVLAKVGYGNIAGLMGM
jgi:hypothetical protein